MSPNYLQLTTAGIVNSTSFGPENPWQKRLITIFVLLLLAGSLSTKLGAQESPPSSVTWTELNRSLPSCEQVMNGLTNLLVSQGYSLSRLPSPVGFVISFIPVKKAESQGSFLLVFLPEGIQFPPPRNLRLDHGGTCQLPDNKTAVYFLYTNRLPEPINQRG